MLFRSRRFLYKLPSGLEEFVIGLEHQGAVPLCKLGVHGILDRQMRASAEQRLGCIGIWNRGSFGVYLFYLCPEVGQSVVLSRRAEDPLGKINSAKALIVER